jgi:hypothetical protein
LGTVTAAIGITPKTATIVTDGLLMYYLAGALVYFNLNEKNRE